jgi:hypothetical protein
MPKCNAVADMQLLLDDHGATCGYVAARLTYPLTIRGPLAFPLPALAYATRDSRHADNSLRLTTNWRI